MKLKINVFTLILLGAFAFAAIAGALPSGIPATHSLAYAEAVSHEAQPLSEQSPANQQAISSAITAHGVQSWHEAGFKGEGVKIGIIDFGFGGIENHIETDVPNPKGVRCYFVSLDPTSPVNFTNDIADCDHTALHFSRLHGASVLEAVYDIAPDADYYIAAVSQFSFYHSDLKDAVDWMISEGVDIIAFSHVGAWSGPGDGTSSYPTSELNTLNNAVSNGITWISPAGDRAQDTWSGFFTDADNDNIHEFASGVECNDVTLAETQHPYRVQLRWADTWGAAERDFELSLIDKGSGQVVATSQKAPFALNDPNELVDFTTPDTQTTYCLRLELKTPTDSQIIVNMQSYGRHGLAHPSLYGSVTSPGESLNTGALTVGAAPVNNTNEIRPFSGRGPLNTGAVKPDLVGADGTHSAVIGSVWEGTSLAAAHVTGLAALVKQRYPGYTPAQTADYLTDNAEARPAFDPLRGQNADPNSTWGHGFAMLPDDVEGATPPSQVDDPLEATKAYVNDAIAAYQADPEAAKEHYQKRESFDEELGLYLLLLDGNTIVVNGAFPISVGSGISWRADPLGHQYGEKLAAADEHGVEVSHLIPISSENYTFREKNAWAIRADGLVFSAGWIDRENDVESAFTEPQKAVGAIIKARARIQTVGLQPTIGYYRTNASIDGEFYVWLGFPGGNIAADAAMPELVGQNIADAYPEIGQDILAAQPEEPRWISHMWRNPVTGQTELKHTYVTRFLSLYIVSGYYDETPPVVDPRAAAKAYVEEAIRAYREDPEAAKAYYQSEASVDRETDLYLILLDGTEIIVNGGFAGVVGDDITSRIGTDAIGKEYGKEIAAADENGAFVDYLIPDPLHNYTLYRKHTWAIKADNGLVFAAGSWDKTEEVESTLKPNERVVGAIYKAGARLLSLGLPQTLGYYNTPASIDGERYVFIIDGDGVTGLAPGTIIADATRPDLLRTNIADLQASDDSELGQKIAALQEGEELWIRHMWRNPATGQEEQKHTYVTKFRGIIFGSGYYGDGPPPGQPGPCLIPIDGEGTYNGSWDETCLSENRPQDSDGGGQAGSDYYARFYTFTLREAADVTISLTSSEDTFLYLMEGSGSDGRVLADNDDISSGDRNSRIEDQSLGAGTYTVEATTYDVEETGDFTLVLDIDVTGKPPAPDVTYIAISSGANHVCAIATGGSVMCWGNDDYGQVSERPTSGSFTEISSGDNHTCALRDDGAVICWGSFNIP